MQHGKAQEWNQQNENRSVPLLAAHAAGTIGIRWCLRASNKLSLDVDHCSPSTCDERLAVAGAHRWLQLSETDAF